MTVKAKAVVPLEVARRALTVKVKAVVPLSVSSALTVADRQLRRGVVVDDRAEALGP